MTRNAYVCVVDARSNVNYIQRDGKIDAFLRPFDNNRQQESSSNIPQGKIDYSFKV